MLCTWVGLEIAWALLARMASIVKALVSPPIEGWPITLARRQPPVRWFETLGGWSQTLAHTPESKRDKRVDLALWGVGRRP